MKLEGCNYAEFEVAEERFKLKAPATDPYSDKLWITQVLGKRKSKCLGYIIVEAGLIVAHPDSGLTTEELRAMLHSGTISKKSSLCFFCKKLPKAVDLYCKSCVEHQVEEWLCQATTLTRQAERLSSRING